MGFGGSMPPSSVSASSSASASAGAEARAGSPGVAPTSAADAAGRGEALTLGERVPMTPSAAARAASASSSAAPSWARRRSACWARGISWLTTTSASVLVTLSPEQQAHQLESTEPPLSTAGAGAAAAALLLRAPPAFVPAPAVAEASAEERPVLRGAAAPAGLVALAVGSLPALADEISSDEVYNQKVLSAAAWCLALALFLVGIIIAQARKVVENKWLN
mmetsp:Transcript_7900/g.24352  ORF Transcript_7900/g.24352 Transcript_7900/m.24352 type:complete len:221 (+) Transcript_7900:768-1430(+)